MTTYTFADLDKWALKSRKRVNAVIRQATNDLLNSIEVVPGINRGGSRIRGTIPRDTGALAASLQSTLYGSTSLSRQGQNEWVFVVADMEAGDVARFAWGGTAAPYAANVYYGAKGVPGTYWIETAAAGWQGFVSEAVRRAKQQVKA